MPQIAFVNESWPGKLAVGTRLEVVSTAPLVVQHGKHRIKVSPRWLDWPACVELRRRPLRIGGTLER